MMISKVKKKDTFRQIRNAKSRLKRLEKRRTDGAETQEAFENAPLAHFAMQFTEYLDVKIQEERHLIARLTIEAKN